VTVPGSRSQPSDPKYLWEEYKLLQDKVDRIGDFHFRIKGWMVTLLAGSSVGAYAARTPAWAFLVTILFAVAAFAIAEWRQSVMERAYLSRLFELEVLLPRFHAFQAATPTSALSKSPAIRRPASPGQAVALQRRPFGTIQRFAFDHDSFLFYGVAVVLSLVAAYAVHESGRRDVGNAAPAAAAGSYPSPEERGAPGQRPLDGHLPTFVRSTHPVETSGATSIAEPESAASGAQVRPQEGQSR